MARIILPLHLVAAEEARQLHRLSDADIELRLKRINKEFRQAFALLREQSDTVTFFGSSSLPEDSIYCRRARELAAKIARELDLTIVSGGGGGIMEAANHGAKDAHEESLGLTIQLPHEQITNPYTTHSADFYYFFSRKVALTFTARAFIYFPGGFGTLDELFEILTLKQTGKIPRIPVVLVGVEFWTPLIEFIQQTLFEKNKTISEADMSLYRLTDDYDEIIQIIAAGGDTVADSKLK